MVALLRLPITRAGGSSMKTIEIPNIADWERKEYLQSRQALASYEKKLCSMDIFCKCCRQLILDLQIHVIDFGKATVCHKCYNLKYRKIKKRLASFPVPENLEHLFPDEKTAEEAAAKLAEQTEADVKEVLAMQNDECDKIKAKYPHQTS